MEKNKKALTKTINLIQPKRLNLNYQMNLILYLYFTLERSYFVKYIYYN